MKRPGLGMMSEQRFAEAARAGLSGREISTLLGGDFKEPARGLVYRRFCRRHA